MALANMNSKQRKKMLLHILITGAYERAVIRDEQAFVKGTS
jgi:hypothetical protein